MMKKVAIHWFRRDLRLDDNRGLYEALKSGLEVIPIFIFDTQILSKLEEKEDKRVSFIHDTLLKLDEKLRGCGSSLLFFHGNPLDSFNHLIENLKKAQIEIETVYTNEDYEPYALERDSAIAEFLKTKEIGLKLFKDSIIFAPGEILKDDGTPYTVYTPFSKRWKLACPANLEHYPSEQHLNSLLKERLPFNEFARIPSLYTLGFIQTPYSAAFNLSLQVIANYDKTRDIPALSNGTTHIGTHLRFGTISIRKCVEDARKLNEIWLNELIWREFFFSIMGQFPYVIDSPFKKQYAAIEWINNPEEFYKWCNGKTGYPIVDAGMRELNATGYMHNRVRMITASFLTKDLLIDWRIGEAYFAAKLMDFELASNNGNWQWVAGCGCDAAPYFRVFSPFEQSKKFDSNGEYVRKWIPELGTPSYPAPCIDHDFARKRALQQYKRALDRL